MRLGFTGTRKSLTLEQQSKLRTLIATIEQQTPISEAHHGDCVGADVAFDRVCFDLGIERHAHPGEHKDGSSPARAYREADVIHEPRWFLDRNHDIVEACSTLIACPYDGETVRSGTWMTIRLARRLQRDVIIIWPDGSVERE